MFVKTFLVLGGVQAVFRATGDARPSACWRSGDGDLSIDHLNDLESLLSSTMITFS